MKGRKILVIEDQVSIRELVRTFLERAGLKVVMARDGIEGLAVFEREQPDLVILDILMPGMDGTRVCREIRKCSNIPIIFMSSRDESSDIIKALEMGGDDYITKPFDMDVLTARVYANLRRAPFFNREIRKEQHSEKIEEDGLHKLKVGKLEIDLLNYEVKAEGRSVPLSVREVQLLAFLIRHPNTIFSVQELYKQIWGAESYGDTRTVNVHIHNIRKKLLPLLDCEFIRNIRGYGYMFVTESLE